MDDTCEYSMAVARQLDDHREIHCEPCKIHGALVHAEEYCVDCKFYLCDNCYTDHQSKESSKNHIYCVVDQTDDTSEGESDETVTNALSESLEDLRCDTTSSHLESEQCVEHFEKFFEYFCETCKQLCCAECLNGRHYSCPNVKNILDIVISKQGNMDEEFQEIDSEFEKLAIERHYFENTIESHTKITTSRRMLALKELKGAREIIDKWFDNLEQLAENEIEKIELEDREALKSAAAKERLLIPDIEKVKSEVSELKQMKRIKKAQFIVIKLALEQIGDIRNRRENLRKEARIRLYNFNLSSEVNDVVKKVKTLGELSFKDSCRKMKVELDVEVPVYSRNNKKKPLIVGLTEVSDRFLVLLDAEVDEHNARPNFMNNSVVVFDLKRNVVGCEVAMETSIFGVTRVKRNQIAITMKVEKKIQLMMVMDSGSLVKGRQIDAGGECIGIICSGENLIVSYIDKIQVLNRKGSVLTKIGANDVFQYPDSLALSPDQETIYMSDMNTNSVTAMTLDGKVKVIYKDIDLKFPSTVTVDKDGSVYVCSTGTKCIHQLTEDCCKVQTIDIAAASIAFSSKGDKLYVGLFDKVQVYNIAKSLEQEDPDTAWTLGPFSKK